MTARRVVTLVCDRDGCRERYVGGDGQSLAKVRAEAAKLSGWRSERGYAPPVIDLCRWHA